MKIVIAPDSFKGSLSSKEAAVSIEAGIRRVYKDAEIVCVPMADGGEGTVHSMVEATGGMIHHVKVKNPLLAEINSFFGILGDGKTAIIEMAAASGLPLLTEQQKNPMITSTYGTGELIKHALDAGCRNFIIGIGGSATNDGGCGMAKALGVRFLDAEENDIADGGGSLSELHRIDISGIDKRLLDCEFTLACDVDNPLCGPAGATYVFGPQKGARGKMLEILDKNLEHYAEILKTTLNVDIINYPGAGAAGGLGVGAMAFLKAKLMKGADIVINTVKLEQHVFNADLVITGEGRIDYQTRFGKTPYAVAQTAKKYNVPVIALVGQIGKDADILYELGIDCIFSIVDGPMRLEEALVNADKLMQNAAERVMRLYRISVWKPLVAVTG